MLKTLTLLIMALSLTGDWTDYVAEHNCQPIVQQVPQPKYGLVIKATPKPVYWKCDNGYTYH